MRKIALITAMLCTLLTTSAQVDVGASALITPTSPICGSSSQSIVVEITNYAASTINFAINNVTVNVSITGASIQTFNSPVLTSGSLAPGASMNVVVTASCNLSAAGTHTFNATTVNFSDVNNSNNAIAPVDIIVNDPPTTANAGTDQTFCAPNGSLSGNMPVVGTGTWTLISGSGTVSSPNSPSSAITGLGVGPNVFRWTIASPPCPDSFDDVIITGEPLPLITLTSGAGSDAQVVCQNTAITSITYSIGGSATGANVSGLPAGVTGNFAAGVFTISGTPATPGIYNYTVTTTGSSCASATANGTITVNPDATIALSSAAGTDGQTVCQNTALTNITYAIGGGGTGASATGLPAGVTGSFSAGTFTVSGTPTTPGTYNYTVTTSGTCAQTAMNGTITVSSDAIIALTSAVGTDAQTVCQNTSITAIAYTIGGGGSGASATGLPAGVSGVFSGGLFTISGSPANPGTFNYTVTTTGTCAQTSANGTITVNPDATITLSSSPATASQNTCINTPVSTITYTIGGGGSGASAAGLPAGVSGSFSAGTFTISGTPTVSGTFSYTVTTTGTCAQTSAGGTITVDPDDTILLTSAAGTDNQNICENTPITPIDYTVGGGATGASASGLPAGVSGTFNAGVLTVSGIPTVPGTYAYTITTSGSCAPATANGTLTVTTGPSIALSSAPGTDAQTVCNGTPITTITYTIGGSATGASASGLPAGVSGSFSAGTFTITGTPSTPGTYNYSVSTTGGSCPAVAASGSITSAVQTIALVSAPFTNDQIICENTPIVPIVYVVGGSGSGADANGLPAGLNSGFSNDTLTISGTPVENGTFFYTITTNGSCTAAMAIGDIHINPAITGNNAGQDTALCENSSLTLVGGSVNGGNGNFNWAWESASNAGGPFNPAAGINTAANYTIGNASSAFPILYFRRIASSGGCVDTSAFVQVIVDSLPQASGSGTETICTGESAIVSGISATGGTISWNHNGSGILSNGSSLTPSYLSSGADAGSNVFLTMTVSSNNSCAPATATAQFVVNVNSAPLATDGGTSSVCPGGASATVMTASAQNGTPSWTHNGTGTLSGSGTLFPTYTAGIGDAGDTVMLQLIVNGTAACNTPQSDTAWHTIIVSPVGNVFMEAGNDAEVSIGNSVPLSAVGPSIVQWNWSPSAGLSDSILPDPVAAPLVTTTYVLTGIDFNGCVAVDSLTITVNHDMNVIIANILTPNGDGYNDTWIIQHIEHYPNTAVTVLNREGIIVYENDNYDNSWDGTYEGKRLPQATYYYVLRFANTDKMYKGAVNILGSYN